MTDQPRISVIIPHFDDLERLDLCLSALSRQSLPRDRFEIVVADNRSPIGREAVEHAISGRARLVDAPEAGAGPARNAGVDAASGTVLAFTDADCVPEPGWLEAGIAALDDYDLIGGRMTVLVSDPAHMSGAEAFETVFAFNNLRYVTREYFTITANLFCTRTVFDAIGPFRTGVSEDKEWCLRARDKGFRIGYAEKACVGHPARRDWPQLKGKWRRLMKESYLLALESGTGGRVRWLLRTWAILPSIPIHALRIAASDTLPSAGRRMAALLTLFRLRLWRFAEGHRLLLSAK